jgi:hypothetical protein
VCIDVSTELKTPSFVLLSCTLFKEMLKVKCKLPTSFFSQKLLAKTFGLEAGN